MPPFGGIKPVCYYRHKTVPEFILSLYDEDGKHISTFSDLKPTRIFCKLRALDLGTFYCLISYARPLC